MNPQSHRSVMHRPRWALPYPVQRSLKTALSTAASAMTVTPHLRSLVREICATVERTATTTEELTDALRVALVNAAIDLGLPPGMERNDFLASLTGVFVEELRNPGRRTRTTLL
jgi:hypothetical protein